MPESVPLSLKQLSIFADACCLLQQNYELYCSIVINLIKNLPPPSIQPSSDMTTRLSAIPSLRCLAVLGVAGSTNATLFKSFQWLMVKQVLLLLLRANILCLKVNSHHKRGASQVYRCRSPSPRMKPMYTQTKVAS